MEVGPEKKAKGNVYVHFFTVHCSSCARCVRMTSFQDHVIVSYWYGGGQIKLILLKSVSVTVKQLSNINNFIVKKKDKAIKVI